MFFVCKWIQYWVIVRSILQPSCFFYYILSYYARLFLLLLVICSLMQSIAPFKILMTNIFMSQVKRSINFFGGWRMRGSSDDHPLICHVRKLLYVGVMANLAYTHTTPYNKLLVFSSFNRYLSASKWVHKQLKCQTKYCPVAFKSQQIFPQTP